MRRALGFAALLACFFAGLLAVAAVLGRIEPFAEFPTLRAKLACLRERAAEIDTLFVGTSRVFRGVMPSVFDRLTVEAGVPTRSFNFGLDAMFAPEDAFVVEQVFRAPPRRLRWLLIESAAFRTSFEDRPAKSIRSIYWHDWPRTWLCIRERLSRKGKRVKWQKWFVSEEGKPTPASEALLHLEVFITRALSIGRGSDAWQRIAFQTSAGPGELGPRGDGFSPMPEAAVMDANARARFEREVAERRVEPARIEPMGRHAKESFERVRALAARNGVQVILLIAPTTAETTTRPDPASGVPTFDFRDVAAYPDLFETAVRSDHTHLNARGAELFTRHLAERFAEYARSQSVSPR